MRIITAKKEVRMVKNQPVYYYNVLTILNYYLSRF